MIDGQPLVQECEWKPKQVWEPVRRGEATATSVYAAQSARCPVTETPNASGYSVWHAFRADDVARILTDPQTFSSAVPKFGAPLIPIEVDPPTHTAYRQLLNKMMSPRRMVSYESAVREAIVEALVPLLINGSGDLVPLTYKLPIRTFCLLMGEGDASFDDLDKARRQGSPSPQHTDEDSVAKRIALMEPLRAFCRKRLQSCRNEPGDDLASDIAHGQIDGKPLSEEESLSILSLIYIAGHGTTTSGMQSALMQIGGDAISQSRLRANPKAIPAAIEESLRLETPLQALPRYCTTDTKIGDRVIRAGDQVYPVYGAANVDPLAFPDPAIFDIDRKPNHFAFGRGIHMCAGAALARMQIRVLLEELLARTDSFAVDGLPVRKQWPQNGCESLTLILQRRSS